MNDNSRFNNEARQQWEAKAGFWDELHGDEGNRFHQLLVAPTAERLLTLRPGELLLDVACGSGVFARQMAALGAQVVAFDFSAGLVERARARTPENAVEYHVLDATDTDALLTLGAGRFHAAVCNMALMDMASIEPLLRALRYLLRPDEGRFVFTVMHPCFNSSDTRMLLERSDRDGQIVETLTLRLESYLQPIARATAGAPGEPNAHYVFHRPLHLLLNTCFRAGFVLDAVEEPAFPPDEALPGRLSWYTMTEFPPVFAGRLRLSG